MIELRWRVGGEPDPWCTLRLVQGGLDLAALAAWWAQRADQILGIDAETNGEDPWHASFRLRYVQVADERESWVVPVRDWSAGALAALVRRHRLWAAHYAEADVRFLQRGLPGEPVRLREETPHVADTQPLLAVLDPRTVTTRNVKDRIDPRIPRPRGLKETVARLLTPELEAARDRLHAEFRRRAPVGHRTKAACVRWGFASVEADDCPELLVYAALDPLLTVRLWHLLVRELRAVGRWGRARAALREQWHADRMTYAGLAVDGPYAWWLDEQLADVVRARTPELAARGVPPSGQGASVAVAMEVLGEGVRRRTNEGAPSWDRSALAAVVEDGGPGAGLAQAILDVRRAGKFRSAYVAPMLDAVTLGDGRLHCRFRNIGAVTTRSAAQDPALHQLPKRDTRVRAAVRAARGCVLVSADFRQGEPFVMAALSGDADYLRDLETTDINSRVAAMVYGAAYDPAQGKAAGTPHYLMRQAAKFAWLAACYGAQPPKVAALLGLPEAEGERIRGQWRSAYPRLWAYADRCNAQATLTLDSGSVVPLWDRWYVDGDTGELRTGWRPSRLGLNGATQGAQADLLKVAVHRLSHHGWVWALRFELHDELLLEVPAWMADEATAVLRECMTVVYRGVTVRCEVTVEGRTWLPQPASFDRGELAAVDD